MSKRFSDYVLEQKRGAEARGLVLDVICLPLSAAGEILFRSDTDPSVSVTDSSVRIHGVKVMWSSDRLPDGRVLLRISNPNHKKRVSNG